MSQHVAALVVLVFAGLYPIVSSGLWLSGAFLFRILDETSRLEPSEGGWPGVTILIPAYNEEQVIGHCVQAALAVDYPDLEVIVLDDGSRDNTAAAATAAGAADSRLDVVRDPVNRGKGDRLNLGFEAARNELVLVTDADTHLHPLAVKRLVARMNRSALVAAVAGAPHVTNRHNLLCALQILEVASIIGLIRRTQALAGRVGVVAGVLGLFRREAVLGVGGYRGEMATEDIDLSWRLLLAGWHTTFEPAALVGMEVPSTLGPLWAQRRRWARGQGEVMHVHLREIVRWRHRWLWALALEGLMSVAWVVSFVAAAVLLALGAIETGVLPAAGVALAWGIAMAVAATVQLSLAIGIKFPYDRLAMLAFLIGPLFPIAYWMLAAAATLRAQIPAVLRGPAEARVRWDIPREPLDTK
jgi:poly-beta-1,6-N-acetyl-D-glucosamine synthase